jgi:hypothetical protein
VLALYDLDQLPTNLSPGDPMKIRDLFDLIRSADELLSSYFENVNTPEQLVSRLEQLKRQDPEGLFDCLEDLRMSTTNALEANIELDGALSGELETSDDLLRDLESFSEDLNETPSQPATEKNLSTEEKGSNPEQG